MKRARLQGDLLEAELRSFATRAFKQVFVEVGDAVVRCRVFHVNMGLELQRKPWVVRDDELVTLPSLVHHKPVIAHVRVRRWREWIVGLTSYAVCLFFTVRASSSAVRVWFRQGRMRAVL